MVYLNILFCHEKFEECDSYIIAICSLKLELLRRHARAFNKGERCRFQQHFRYTVHANWTHAYKTLSIRSSKERRRRGPATAGRVHLPRSEAPSVMRAAKSGCRHAPVNIGALRNSGIGAAINTLPNIGATKMVKRIKGIKECVRECRESH